ncbi:phage tail protein [Burkholderia gladioli]|uniref:phage tail protein n=1 Tax=Burkholderia gladioli TaxID=28095 RepID=UPI001640B416|nr:phage tail protein [Burkholderia gladioli]
MNKPASLRAAILAAVPALVATPDAMLMSISAGAVVSTGARSASFDYEYDCEVNLWATAADIDNVTIALLEWIRLNEPAIVANPDLRRTGFTFYANLLADDRVNLDIKLKLSESVMVSVGADGKRVIQYVIDADSPWLP